MREQILLNAIDKGVSPAWMAHWANMGVHNIFNRWFKAPAIMTIKDESKTPYRDTEEVKMIKTRYSITRTNYEPGHGTSAYHARPYFGCVTASVFPNRCPLLCEIKDENRQSDTSGKPTMGSQVFDNQR